MKFKLTKLTRNITDKMLLDDLKHAANELGCERLTKRDYQKVGKYNTTTIRNRFGSWNAALRHAGLKLNYNRGINKLEMLLNLKRLWKKLGRQPKVKDLKLSISEFTYRTYTHFFGSLRNALNEMIDYCNKERKNKLKTPFRKTKPSKPGRTNRKAGFILRYKVLERDGYKCVICGNSPAFGNGIRLHIDHIIPYSKGGETVFTNLQTLCQPCNLGKGNRL